MQEALLGLALIMGVPLTLVGFALGFRELFYN